MTAADVLIRLGFGLAAAFVGGPLTVLAFRIIDGSKRVTRQRDSESDQQRQQRNREHPAFASTLSDAGERLRGGAWIGVLERIAVYGAILAGSTELVALTLAVKGLGRYPELRSGDNPATAERFIIGTFISVLSACAFAVLARWLTN